LSDGQVISLVGSSLNLLNQPSILVSSSSVIDMSKCELYPREPISHASETSLHPVQLLTVPISSISPLPLLISWLILLWIYIFTEWNAKNNSSGFNGSPLSLLIIKSILNNSIRVVWGSI
jgi:hypothetical protein